MFKKTFKDTLLIPVHTVARVNYKAIRNQLFHHYLNKLQKINSAYKGGLHQWLQGIFFVLYAWNSGLVNRFEIS